ncbi:MAG: GatB/YqeY domain-containing protein, partial [Patescibacteria group bacterium]|nr:GatB/YqeY domain-containing protein [Patescibacteria group bacterium]
IQEQLKDAMKAKDEVRLRTIRNMLTSFTNELVALGKKPQETLPDEAALAVIKRLAKQRKDSIEQFQKGNRPDLVARESEELAVLEGYLPRLMSREEIEPILRRKKEELGIADRAHMGQLIGAVLKELGGTADGADVKAVAEQLLS